MAVAVDGFTVHINCPWETSVLYLAENFTDVDEPRRSRTCQVSRDPEFRLKCYE